MISLKSIRTASSPQSYTRGNQVYKQGKILGFEETGDGTFIRYDAAVAGSMGRAYGVSVRFDTQKDQFADYTCECQAWQSYPGMCKHCVAVALKAFYAQTMHGQNPGSDLAEARKFARAKATDKEVEHIIYASSMREKARYLQPELTGQVELIPFFKRENQDWSMEFKIGAAQKYVVKNISQMVEAMERNEWVEYGKKLAFFHEKSVFTVQGQALLNLLEAYILHEREVMQSYNHRHAYPFRSGRYYAPSDIETLTKRKLSLTDEWMVRFAEILEGQSCEAEIDGMRAELTFKKGNPRIRTAIKAGEDGGYQLKVPEAEVFQGLGRVCIRAGAVIYVCDREFSSRLCLIGSLFSGKARTYGIHPRDASSFCASVLPILKEYTSCSVDKEMEQYEPQPCEIQVYLDCQDGEVTAKAACIYGDSSYNVIESVSVSGMYRDFEKESALVKLLNQFFPFRDEKKKVFVIGKEEEEALYGLLEEGIGRLQQMGQVFVSESLRRIKVVRTPGIRIGIGISSGLLDVDIQTERMSLDELEGILDSYRRKKKYFRLPDGSFLGLEDSGLSAVAELAEGLELAGSQLAEGHLRIPGYRSFYLDQILRENEGDIRVERSRSFKGLLREMKNVEDSDFEEPDGLEAQLRPYQKFGYRWMMTLKRLGFGGILADDMGLGKTVQTIAYLLAQKQAIGLASSDPETEQCDYLGLVVCPASLVYNWESEIRKFAPALAVVTVTGTASVRREMIARKEGEILLTSYDLLKRDVEWYRDIRFGTVIIDEAQNIKNYTTQTAKAVKILHSIQRFALTGTPIENSLSELWSIFDFLMPGILNSSRHFRTQYEQPIAAGQDERVSARLKKMIRPYILRRIKSDVLKELPDKIEKVLYCQMGEKQRSLYDANLQKLLIFLKGQSAEEFRTGKLQVLAELTKLRQLCCDPSMVYENYDGESAKLEICMEVVRSGAASGNQMLLFSQFTSALERIGRRLEAEGIPYYILTGGTSKEKRSRMVEDFNRDKTPVFLISLKAGGTGLNLTAASIVIHFDPWWNMAAQSQATDRAHRIGQRQVVTVYQLLTRETLEEKIHELQKKKARLSDEIISEGSIQDTLATKEELFAILDNSL